MEAAFVSWAWAVIRADATIKTLMNDTTPGVYLDMAPPDPAFPYVVHSLNLTAAPATWAIREGVWLIDVWDYSQNKSRALNIADRIAALFDRRYYEDPAGEEFVAARIWFINSASVPTDAERVWRVATQFGIRAYAKAHAEAVLDRDV